jgi:hypothetical protein
VVECTAAPAADWQAFASAHGEFYHDPRWVDTLASCFGYRLHCLSHRDGGALTGILALAEVPGLLGPRRLVSLPFSYAAGPLVTSAAVAEALMAGARERAKALGIGRIEVKQVVADVAAPAPMTYIRRLRYSAYRLDTTAGEAAVLQRFHADSTRRGIRKSEREGVQVRRGTEPADWTALALLEEETARSHGVPAPPRGFFTAACRGLQAAGLADLYLAEARDRAGAIAGIVVWKGPRRWIYAFGASRTDALGLRPNHALLWTAIRGAIAAGVGFDFGRAAPEQEGLVEFKRRWGGVAVPLAYDYWPQAGGLNTGDRSRGPLAWAARFWSFLPRPLTRAGSVLYRYLG